MTKWSVFYPPFYPSGIPAGGHKIIFCKNLILRIIDYTQDSKKVKIAQKILARRGCKQIVIVGGDNKGTVEVGNLPNK